MKLALLLVMLVAGTAHAQDARVLEVVTATGDAQDVLVLGDRVFVATSGGLAVMQSGATRVLGTREGLPGARVRSISVIDDRAYAGCVEGVAEIDLPTLRVLRTFDVPRVSRVVRHGETLWMGSRSHGLHRVDGDRTRLVRVGPRRSRDRVNDLAVVNGELLVATGGGGVLRVNERGRLLGRVTALPSPIVNGLFVDRDRVLVATIAGVGVLGRADASIAQLNAALPVRDVRAITRHGNALWVSAWGAGTFSFSRGTLRAVSRDPEPHAMAGAFLAGSSGLYEVVDGTPVARLSGGAPADVTSLAEAFGALWIGTYSDGLATLDAAGHVTRVAGLSERWHTDARINDLAVTRGDEEKLWIATDRGLFVSDGRTFMPVTGRDAPGAVHVTDLHVDAHGALWIAASRTLTRYADGTLTAYRGDESLPIVALQSVTTDDAGDVWVGSVHGLFHFDEAEGFALHGVATGELPVDWVTAVAPYGDGIVAGTYHGGLVFFEGGDVRTPTLPEGTGWVNIHALHVAGDLLVVGTLDRGLLYGRGTSFKVLTRRDGLPSSDVTAIAPNADGTYWVGTRAGLARVAID